MDVLIFSIERAFPDLHWLVRDTKPGRDRETIGGAYLAHIHSADFSASFVGVGDTPVDALQTAFNRAKLASAA